MPIGAGRSTHVGVLGPPILGDLSWGSSFFAYFHDALRSRAVVLEKLSERDVAAAVAAITGAR
ncbi:hypothetical protein [Sandaracinus amylolyticus]|uniref:hypothetical protein n=1 Tax=Sandaracinus amylolyticus TaxID=927083 RepID=UPI001F3E1286|nr:hypothetical protein [Sandaracinus amylolyticus]UJR84335.1 Hypothetical protein I5071_64140 [Sandaracinus amylolyticus]